MKRRFDPTSPELMDRPQPVTPELARDLQNLRKLNRYFGSYRLIEHFLRRWLTPGSRMRIVDLATGSGDIPRLVVDYARRVKAAVTIDAVDQQPSTVEIARSLSSEYPEIEFIEANVLRFDRDPYDIVLCSLALHHFSEADAVAVLRHCRELSKKYVLVSDLRRGWLASAGVYLLTAVLFREEMTQIDARLSAERAFSLDEFRRLAEQAGWTNFGHAKFAFARQALWLEAIS
jgi:2-polyprenyl-3-methyl-5-hydroxy-6-metoxy-1,4-benzoquinol methylase